VLIRHGLATRMSSAYVVVPLLLLYIFKDVSSGKLSQLRNLAICISWSKRDEVGKVVWASFAEFWIYSINGKFYLKVVIYASLVLGAENPRNRCYINYTLRKSAQSFSQLASLAQIFGEESGPLLLIEYSKVIALRCAVNEWHTIFSANRCTDTVKEFNRPIVFIVQGC
jgi:hypothetical protein